MAQVVNKTKEALGEPFHVLSLDGGGSKGFYTLGVLLEIEAMLGRPINEAFDLIFGTSTGAIIAALLALGHSVKDIRDLYAQYVPNVMSERFPDGKSRRLRELVDKVFGDASFGDVKTGVGIVATRWEMEKPMIFKGSIAQAHGRQATFVPGFGCTVADAVYASCSAYPIFKKAEVTTSDGDVVTLFDGGFCANNPTLYAIADAVHALKIPRSCLRVVSVGVGAHPKPRRWYSGFLQPLTHLVEKSLGVNTASMETLRWILFKDVKAIRISETFHKPETAMDFTEGNLRKLNLIFQQGRESFASRESDLRELLQARMRERD